MKIINKLILVLLFIVFLCSCESEKGKRSKLIYEQTRDILANSMVESMSLNINKDSVIVEFRKIPSDSAELRLRFAQKFENGIKSRIQARNKSNSEVNDKLWKKSKAYKIKSKHPDWDRSDCEKLANREIWIGMSIGMLHYLRGLPEHVNKSDYGNGIQYQWCWTELSPSCFYGGEDGIITAYN